MLRTAWRQWRGKDDHIQVIQCLATVNYFMNKGTFFHIRMLTGDEFKSGGEANLMGFDLQGSRRDFLRNIGYCPQFDSIIEVLTGREMLRLFARLRGIPSADIESNIDKWLDFLSIQQGL